MAEGLKQTSQCLGYAQYTGLSSAIALTASPATGHSLPSTDPNQYGARALVALLQAEVANIRWTDDGSTPQATVGMILYAGDQPFLYDGDLNKIKFIQASSGAVLNVQYYR